MHGRFYHRACFQSMWRGGFEGEGCYYSPQGACPLQRGCHHTAGRRLAWMLPNPGNPRGVEMNTKNTKLIFTPKTKHDATLESETFLARQSIHLVNTEESLRQTHKHTQSIHTVFILYTCTRSCHFA